MRDLLQLGLAAADLASARPDPLRGRNVSRAVILAVSVGLCAIASAGCLSAALWIYAIPFVGPAGAPLVVAAVLLVAAVVMVAAIRQSTPPPPPVAPDATLLLAEAARLTRAHQAPMLLAALVAGLELGKRA